MVNICQWQICTSGEIISTRLTGKGSLVLLNTFFQEFSSRQDMNWTDDSFKNSEKEIMLWFINAINKHSKAVAIKMTITVDRNVDVQSQYKSS